MFQLIHIFTNHQPQPPLFTKPQVHASPLSLHRYAKASGLSVDMSMFGGEIGRWKLEDFPRLDFAVVFSIYLFGGYFNRIFQVKLQINNEDCLIIFANGDGEDFKSLHCFVCKKPNW